MNLELVAASTGYEHSVRRLLTSCGLPVHGLELAWPGEYVVALAAGAEVVGCAGLEIYGKHALLRSVAVAEDWQGQGIGTRLIVNRIDAAHRSELSAVYLLTTTASGFFELLGFKTIERGLVPPGVRASAEFASICPASAVVLTRSLR